MREVRKEEVEEQLGCSITDSQFAEALEYAKRKQEHICKSEDNQVAMQHWYLVMLIKEYVCNLAFSCFTKDLYKFCNMKKERSVKDQSTPTGNHIVNHFTL